MYWVAAAVIVLAQLVPASTASAQSEHKQLLVLHSTRRDAQISVIAESELARILDVGLAQNLDYYAEFIDLVRFPEPTYKDAFRDYLRLKYKGVRFDLVIALQEAAIEFVNGQRTTLFRDTPVVFLTNVAATRRSPNSTGLIQERNFAATVAFLRTLQPDVRHVFVVTGAAGVDEEYKQAVQRQLRSSDTELTFTYLSGLPTQELEERLSTLPEHSAVYYVLVSEDGAGDKFHPLDYVNRVAAAANAPTYSWVDSTMDHGIVGGSLYRQTDAIERVGQLALRVLGGEPPDSIPIAALNSNANYVDWRQLERWGIDEARVPPGTLVRFRDPTLWDRYKTFIVAALTVLVMQTALITGLLIQRKRRRRAEEELREGQGELRRSHVRIRDLGGRLLAAQETERSRIARELHDDICQRMLLLTIELESLRRAPLDERPATEALTTAQDIAKSLHDLSHRLHPSGLRMIGLAASLEHLCHELSRTGVAIAYTHDDVPATLPPDLMLCLFRVAQEALQNAIKYSNAKELSVHLSGGSGQLVLTMIDNGVGFDVDAAWGKGVGLVSMVERLEVIGGSLDIRSNPGAGTVLTATVPAPPPLLGLHSVETVST